VYDDDIISAIVALSRQDSEGIMSNNDGIYGGIAA
jgi:hypothetical protein